MEDIKQKIVLPTKGVCNTTPDPICGDDEMEDCVGLTYSDDAIRPIQDVKQFLNLDGELLFVQEPNCGGKIYIYRTSIGMSFYNVDDGVEYTGKILRADSADYTTKLIKSVGNTLIITTETGMYYFLWKNTYHEYKALGEKIPETEVEFWMENPVATGVNQVPYETYVEDATGIIKNGGVNKGAVLDVDYDGGEMEDEAYQKWDDLAYGCYAAARKKIQQYAAFSNPFWARYAIELYDGTYSMISNPILMLPSLMDNCYFRLLDNDDVCRVICTVYFARLAYKVLSKPGKDWSDIVRGVTIFVSEEVDLHYLSGYQCYLGGSYGQFRAHEGIWAEKDATNPIPQYVVHLSKSYDETGNQPKWRALATKGYTELIDDLLASSQFFKLLDLTQDSGTITASSVRTTVLNITTQTQLDVDDFYSHCTLFPQVMETANRRLNLASVRRGFFSGFTEFLRYRLSNEETASVIYPYSAKYVVTIETPDGSVDVVSDSDSHYDMLLMYWFFYPDTRAKRVRKYVMWHSAPNTSVKQGVWYLIADKELKEHKRLNGAYSFDVLPTSDAGSQHTHPEAYIIRQEDPVASGIDYEYLSNYVIQSQVDNPFSFDASSYIRVGQGTILALAFLTTALNQDAYKVATTIVFTTQGIWALQINDSGEYKNVTPPFSREVISNVDSLALVDNGLFYVSKKGLMLINDEYGNKCISTQLCGKNAKDYDSFIDFLQTCKKMAYDYRDSQLWITNDSKDSKDNYIYDYHWVYNIKTGTLSRMKDGNVFQSIVSDFPDTLLQNMDNDIFTMYNEPNINDDPNSYSGSFVTRPMKFEQAMALKTIRDVKNITDFNGRLLYSIITVVNFQNTGTTSGDGKYAYGEKVKLTATPATGYYFVMWVDEKGKAYHDLTIEVEVTKCTFYRAIFSIDPSYKGDDRPEEGEHNPDPVVPDPEYSYDDEVKLSILVSNDCHNWQELESYRGRGFKYYKFKYAFSGMSAYDAFCGTVLYYSTRETDRLR